MSVDPIGLPGIAGPRPEITHRSVMKDCRKLLGHFGELSTRIADGAFRAGELANAQGGDRRCGPTHVVAAPLGDFYQPQEHPTMRWLTLDETRSFSPTVTDGVKCAMDALLSQQRHK